MQQQAHWRRVGVAALACAMTAVITAPAADAGPGTWHPTGSMSQVRDHHTATRLHDGRVLVVGGNGADGAPTATAEIYNPASKTWSSTGSMLLPRSSHTATLLKGNGCGARCGFVLVVGGYSASSSGSENASNSAELYNPADGTWLPAAPMTDLRAHHTATLLPSGIVLVAGGVVTDTSAPPQVNQGAAVAGDSAELYDPAANAWNATQTLMTRARAWHTATLLKDGRVLLAGRIGSNSHTAELYNPTTRRFSATGAMAAGRSQHTATLLPNGKVLVAGGDGSGNPAELYDPTAGTWSATGTMLNGRSDHTAVLLPDGQVLVAGGTGAGRKVERYVPSTGVWKAGDPLTTFRAFHTATLLKDGKVLTTGGSELSSAELFKPTI